MEALFGEWEEGEILNALMDMHAESMPVAPPPKEEDDPVLDRVQSILAHACMGCECHYVHPMFKLKYTDNVKELAEVAGAYWLIDAIFSWQPELKKSSRWKHLAHFQHWTLEVFDDPQEHNEESAETVKKFTGSDEAASYLAVLTCTDGGVNGSNAKVVAQQYIEYTDFPKVGEVSFYMEGDVLLLSAEH